MYSTPFGPIVDGAIVPDLPHEAKMRLALRNYQVMLGVTESEAISMFSANMGKSGILKHDV